MLQFAPQVAKSSLLLSMLAVDSYITRPEQGVTVLNVYRSDTLAAVGRFYDLAGPVFVTFAFREAVNVPFGFSVFSKYKINAIYVLCSGSDWYQYLDAPALGNAVHRATRNFARVVLYGASMGAYAALMFSDMMGADIVLAMSPQASIDRIKVPFEKRWSTEADEITSRGGFVHDDLNKCLTRSGRVIVVYDPDDDDGKHVGLIQTVRPVDTVIIPFSRHRALMCISEMRLASEMLNDASAGKLDLENLRQQIRTRRRESATYSRSVGRYLLLKNARGAIDMLRTAAEKTKPSDLEGLEGNFRLINRAAGGVAALPHLLRLIKSINYLNNGHAIADLKRFAPVIFEAGATSEFMAALEDAAAVFGQAGLNATIALAWLTVQAGDNERAVERLQILEHSEEAGSVALEAAKLYRYIGLNELATARARHAYDKTGSLDALYFLADQLELSGMPLDAAALYQEHDQRLPLPAKPHRYRLAVALLSAGQTAAALCECKKILAEDDSYAAAYRLEGEILTKLDRHELACSSFRKAVACSPNDIGILHKYALAAALAKNFVEAKIVAKRVVGLDGRRASLIDEVLRIEKAATEYCPGSGQPLDQEHDLSKRTQYLKSCNPMAEVTSCIFLTMPTSGTGSLWRLLSIIAGPAYERVKIAEQYEAAGRGKELPDWQPEPTGKLYMYNTPHYINPSFADLKYKLITNFRDPRDLACNQFHWSQSHPMPKNTEAEIQAYRESVLAAGIDAFVLKGDNNILFRSLRALEARVLKPGPETLNISYAQLCLDFDGMVARIIAFLGADPATVPREKIELERAVNLKHNPNWIGQIWTGTDIMPGRHRGELKPETIKALNDKYRDNLKFVRGLEVPALRAYLATEAEQDEMNRVAVGRQDQLFLKNDANNTMAQITGQTRVPPRELLRIGMSHRCRQIFGTEVAGFTYGHAIIPSKEVAHRADLPEDIVFEQHGPRPITQYLASPAAKLWRPFYDAALLTPKGNKRFFPKTDTHWNHEAAMLYFGAFLRHVMPALAPLFDAVPLRRFPSEQRGDLGMKLELPAEAIEIVAVERSGARVVFENGINNEGCVRLYRNDLAPLQKKVFVMHDSFTSWLIQNISAVFRDVLFFHGTVFDYDFIDKFRPDLVLCLQAERFFVRAPETGGDMSAFIAQQEKEKSASVHFADLLATF